MHNLFLGTAKHLADIWKERGYFNDAAIRQIEERIRGMTVPAGLGRIPEFASGGLSG